MSSTNECLFNLFVFFPNHLAKQPAHLLMGTSVVVEAADEETELGFSFITSREQTQGRRLGGLHRTQHVRGKLCLLHLLRSQSTVLLRLILSGIKQQVVLLKAPLLKMNNYEALLNSGRAGT